MKKDFCKSFRFYYNTQRPRLDISWISMRSSSFTISLKNFVRFFSSLIIFLVFLHIVLKCVCVTSFALLPMDY